MPVATIASYTLLLQSFRFLLTPKTHGCVECRYCRSKYLPYLLTVRDRGNAKRLLGTIFAIHVGNEEDEQTDKCSE
jgi:hypothetical protein